MKYKLIFTLLTLVMFSTILFADGPMPPWNNSDVTVYPGHGMTVQGNLIVDGTNAANNIQLAAFIGDELRGLTNPWNGLFDIYINCAEIENGALISFKIWDPIQEKISDNVVISGG